MKNICLDMQPIWSKKAGIGWYTYKIVEKLIENNKYSYEGIIFNPLNVRKIEKIKNFRCKEIKYFWPYYNYGGLFSKKIFKWKFVSFNKITKTNSDIYHFFNFTIPKKLKGKIIVTIHDTIHKVVTKGINFNIEEFDKEIKYSLENSNIVITVSNAAKDDILRYYGEKYKEKIRVVEPGINLKEYNVEIALAEKESILEKLKLSSEDELMFFVGTLQERKNIVNIIKAYNLYREMNKTTKLKLLLAGNPGLGYEKIEEEYNNSKYKEDIKILSYISESEKINLYKISKIFIFPSLYEGFGMPIVEAMASGAAVITSNVSSMPEVGGDAVLLVNPYSIEEIKNAIEKYEMDNEFRNEKIKKGYVRCKGYTWENSVKKMEKIYEEL